jgi:AraC family transcriptional regulator, regulatory protein of adaptative response / methylated-DNA-[protein]-cysteine methyltransferase
MQLATISTDATRPSTRPSTSDYDVVRRAIEFISLRWRAQPSLDEIAAHVGMKPLALQRLFTRWAGLSPKGFLQAVTLDRARTLLADSASVLDASYAVGLSGPARLHDLFVSHEAMTPGDWKAKGEGLVIRYGFHPSPFGTALAMATDRGLAGLAFADEGGEDGALADMCSRWPRATYVEDLVTTAPYVRRIFDPATWRADRPLRVVMIGSDFELTVWEALLRVPFGRAATYSDIAGLIGRPTATRAVGSAIGRNPLSFVIPCHRILGKDGGLHGYHWGLTRKRAILGWEAGVSSADGD